MVVFIKKWEIVKTSFQHQNEDKYIKIKCIIQEGKSYKFKENYGDKTQITITLQNNIGLYWIDLKNKVQVTIKLCILPQYSRTIMHHSSISIQTHLETYSFEIMWLEIDFHIFQSTVIGYTNVLTGYKNKNLAFLEKLQL